MLLTQAMVNEAMSRVSEKKVREFELNPDFFARLQLLSELELAGSLALLKTVNYNACWDFVYYLGSWTTNNEQLIKHVLETVPGLRRQDKILSTAGFLINHLHLVRSR